METGSMEFSSPESFSARLKRLREQNGYTQEKLGETMGVTRQTISSWERGRTEPDIAALKMLAKLYNVTLDDLLAGYQNGRRVRAVTPASLTLYLAGLVLVLLGIAALAAGKLEIGTLFGAAFPALFMNSLVFITFSCMIKSGNFTALAGYDPDLHYSLPAMRRMLGILRIWWCGSGDLCTLFLLGSAFVPERPDWFVPFFMVSYLIELVLSTLVISNRSQKELLPDKRDDWARNTSAQPLVLFFASFAVLLFTFIGSFVGFGLHNNTPEAAAAALPLILSLVVITACLITQQSHAGRMAQEGKPFRLHPAAWAGYGSTLLFAVWIVFACAAGAPK